MMVINEKRHGQALEVEKAATEEYERTATYWLALACCLLTSPVKAERETGKAIVKRWKYKKSPA